MNSLMSGEPTVPNVSPVVLTPSMTYWFSSEVDPEKAIPPASPCEPGAAPSVLEKVRPGIGTFCIWSCVMRVPWLVLVGSIVEPEPRTSITSPPCRARSRVCSTQVTWPSGTVTPRRCTSRFA